MLCEDLTVQALELESGGEAAKEIRYFGMY